MTNIHVEEAGAVRVITIDRRERFNSLDVETARDFRRAGLQCARDTAVRAVVLRGLPGVFCSGADLKFIKEQQPHYGDAFKEILEYIHSAISEIRRAPKPFIAAVDGVAAAGGFGIAMACDLVIASTRATFEWAYGKTALTGAESATFLLPRLIGMRRSMELVLLNPRVTAVQALDWGLVTAVHEVEVLDTKALEIAQRLADGPARAYAVAKDLLNASAGFDRFDLHLARELQELTRVADGPEVAEGMRAFFEKRPPQFGLKRSTTEDTGDTEEPSCTEKAFPSMSCVCSVVER
jgi:2-(1,2-epoxy-1,2-dihydrophenyl)acetyl-CoA isomerase